jgi:Ran GTPase-activating protein (RanGAP) involved in mRNA processing and transport
VGVEMLMNAIWGSKTLREIKLDNNQIRDRGAQLAAVVLTSVDLEILDMGFNRLTIVGIKALMKSLAENCSLLTLTLSGNVLDTNASKAVSYALSYNKTIRKLYVDHCLLSYAAQRHIAAGIVSNSNLALRVMSGFPLGGEFSVDLV